MNKRLSDSQMGNKRSLVNFYTQAIPFVTKEIWSANLLPNFANQITFHLCMIGDNPSKIWMIWNTACLHFEGETANFWTIGIFRGN